MLQGTAAERSRASTKCGTLISLAGRRRHCPRRHHHPTTPDVARDRDTRHARSLASRPRGHAPRDRGVGRREAAPRRPLGGQPLASGAEGETRAIRPLHGLVELTVDGDDVAPLLGVVASLAAELGRAVDWSASAVSIGVVHRVVPARADIVLLALAATRKPTLDRKGFHDYWLEQHAALAMSLLDDEHKAKMGYEQVHADEKATATATALAGTTPAPYNGVLECSLAVITDLPHLTVPGFSDAIVKDEENFVDHSAVMFGSFLRTLHREGASS